MNLNLNLTSLNLIIKKWASLVIILPVGLICIVVTLVIAFRLGDARKNYDSLRKDLKAYREAIWSIKDVEVQKLNQEIISTHNQFPAADKLAMVIKDISELAKNDKVKVASISPGQQTDVEESEMPFLSTLSRIRIDIRLEGSYENIASFFAHLSQLNAGVIKVSSYRLDKPASSSNLNAVMEANVYVRKASDQDLFQAALEGDLGPVKNKSVSRYQSYLRNPFVEEITTIQSPGVGFRLEGIIYDPAQPIALIDGEARRIGDQVGDAKIVTIERNRVVFRRGNEEFEISLGPT